MTKFPVIFGIICAQTFPIDDVNILFPSPTTTNLDPSQIILFNLLDAIVFVFQKVPSVDVEDVPSSPTIINFDAPYAMDLKLLEVFDGILVNAVEPTPTAEKIAPLYPTEIHLLISEK